MAKSQLDSLDYRILKSLSVSGRKPYLEIARECNVSGAAIHQRIQKLNSMGVLKGSECLIDPSSVGYDTCTYVGASVKDMARFDEVIESLRNIPQVVEVHFTTGRYDLLMKIYAHNNDHLLDILLNKLQRIGLTRTESLISFKEVFRRQLPIDGAEE